MDAGARAIALMRGGKRAVECWPGTCKGNNAGGVTAVTAVW
jgi:hypothetical protein